MEYYTSSPSFITIKDHKSPFRNKAKCRLVNPAKNEFGLVSEKHLEKVIANVASFVKVNQKRKNVTALDWLKSLPQRGNSSFVKIDIVEFYLSKSEELLNDSISFARSVILSTTQENLSFLIKHPHASRKETILCLMLRCDLMIESKFVSLLDFTF